MSGQEKLAIILVDEKIPDYGYLRPVTSQWAGHYEKTKLASSKSFVVSAGYHSESKPLYLPPCWSAHTHPEGQLYFSRNSPLRIVTEAYLYSPEILDKVLYWTKHIEARVLEKQIPLSEAIELFILIDEEGCAYYLVNRNTCTQFWLDEHDTIELGIPAVDSESHLRLALTELYWMHVEYFPMHFGGLPVETIDELISITSHALTDQITSKTSNYCWSREDCAQFLKVLKIAREHNTDGHQVCAVARLWRITAHNRFENHHGQEAARISRDQSILFAHPRSGRISAVFNLLTFKTSSRYQAHLNDIFIDRYVYISQWQPFISKTISEWKRVSFESFCCLLLHVLLFYLPHCQITIPFAIISGLLLLGSIVASNFLVHRYNRLDNITAGEAFTHLNAIYSEKRGFEIVSLIYALPTALHLWGLGLLSLNAIMTLVSYLSLFFGEYGFYYGLGAIVFVAGLCLCFQRLTSETVRFSMVNLKSFMRRRHADNVDSPV